MADRNGTPGERWWSWLHYGKGTCPGRPQHPRAHRYGACMDCWDKLVASIKREAIKDHLAAAAKAGLRGADG